MPKSLLIDPAEARQRGTLTAPAIPLNAYVPDPKAEKAKYGRGDLVRMYRDMALIREFETMLDRIKKEGVYEGIAYNHKGPAHLSIGQEAAAVGQAYHLGPDDFIFGSHRSHGEIIAKSLSAIARMREVDVQRVKESYLDGAVLDAAGSSAPAVIGLNDGTIGATSFRSGVVCLAYRPSPDRSDGADSLAIRSRRVPPCPPRWSPGGAPAPGHHLLLIIRRPLYPAPPRTRGFRIEFHQQTGCICRT